MDPARVYDRLSVSKAQWIGGGTYKVGSGAITPSDANGIIPTPIGYTGTWSGVNYTINRTATATCQPAPTATAGAVASTTKNSWSSTTTSAPSVASVNLGDGNTVTVNYGPYTIDYTQNSYIQKSVTMSRTYTFTIAGGAYPAAQLGLTFPVTDPPVPLKLFTDVSTATTTTTEYTLDTKTYDVPNATTITVPQSSKVTVNGPTTTGVTIRVGSALSNNVWQPSGGWPAGYTGATLVARLKHEYQEARQRLAS